MGLAGASGCGKTTTALALMRLLPYNGRIVRGSISFEGRDLVPVPEDSMRAIRWKEMSIVFQGAMNSLNPAQRICRQIAEPIMLHEEAEPEASFKRAGDLLELVGISRNRLSDYPHEFSGGMRQRVMVAMALACTPKLVIADEPVPALDVMIQAQILDLLERLRRELHLAMILISHDLSVLADTCEQVTIMYAGKTMESGKTMDLFTDPKHPYTQGLGRLPGHPRTEEHARSDSGRRPEPHLASERLRLPSPVQVCVRPVHEGGARTDRIVRGTPRSMFPVPAGHRGAPTTDRDHRSLIRIRNLKVWFPLRKGLLRELAGGKPLWVRAVDGVDLDIRRGEVFCLVGESGCGKTSTGKAILKLVEATDGDILLEMPEGEARAYEDVRRRPDDPEARKTLDGLRRKYSVTWKESLPWTVGQALKSAGAFLAAVFLAIVAPSLLLAAVVEPFGDPWSTIGLCVSIGLILGLIGSLPPTRLSRRTRVILTLLTLGSIIVAPISALSLHRALVGDVSRFDVGSALATPWTQELAAMLVGFAFGAIAAGGSSSLLLDWRERSEGMAGIHMRSIRRRLQLIVQDPYESLNPKQSVYEIVSEPLAVNRISTNPGETSALVREALTDVGLRPPEEFLFRFPHELSGGQRQRVSIAAALVLQPDFIVADEPVSMLDVSIRTEILQVMMELRTRRGITYLFITHDLSLAWVLADRIAVMYLGKIVEMGTTEQVIGHPMHPYTKALISVVPSPDPRHKVERIILKGERPDPSDIPPGCRFHPRCPFAFERCGWTAEEVADQLRWLKARGMLASASGVDISEAGNGRLWIGGGGADAPVHGLHDLRSDHTHPLLPVLVIASVHATNGFVELSLHASSEPPLLEIEPGNSVACHLVSPPATVSESLTA